MASPASAAPPETTYDEATGMTTFAVQVGPDEYIKYSVVVDRETGLDVCPHSGNLQPREATVANVREVYAVGKEALGPDLERYNKWLAQNPGKEERLFGANDGAAAAAAGSSSSGTAVPPSSTADHTGDQAPAPVEQARALYEHQKRVAAAKDAQEVAAKAAAAASTVEDLTGQAEEAKSKGNASLTRGDNRQAIKHYTAGMELDDSVVALWANRAEAHLRLRRFHDALSDAERALALSPNGRHEKAHFRKVAALKGLRLFRQAHDEACCAQGLYTNDTVWAPLVRELAGAPSLLLDTVIDTADLSAGSAGFCAVRLVEAPRPAAWAADKLGELPVVLAWRPAQLRERCPNLSAYGELCNAQVISAAALRLVRDEVDAVPTEASFMAQVNQYAGVLGKGFDIGHDDAAVAAIASSVDLAEWLFSTDDKTRASVEGELLGALALPSTARGDLTSAMDRIRKRQSVDAIASFLAAVSALAPAQPMRWTDADDTEVNAFALQTQFFGASNPAWDFAGHGGSVRFVDLRVAPSSASSAADSELAKTTERPDAVLVNHARLVLEVSLGGDDAATSHADATGSWLRLLSTAEARRVASAPQQQDQVDWYGCHVRHDNVRPRHWWDDGVV